MCRILTLTGLCWYVLIKQWTFKKQSFLEHWLRNYIYVCICQYVAVFNKQHYKGNIKFLLILKRVLRSFYVLFLCHGKCVIIYVCKYININAVEPTHKKPYVHYSVWNCRKHNFRYSRHPHSCTPLHLSDLLSE